MLILHVSIYVKPEFVERFLDRRPAKTQTTAFASQALRVSDLVRHSEDPHRFALGEVYRTEEAIAAHKTTPHYAKWTEAVAEMMAEPRTRTWYASVYPDDGAW